MHRHLLLFILPLLALASCSGNGSSSSDSDFSSDKLRLDRSGDLLVSQASTYATIGNQRTYSQMLKAMDSGETVLFSFASYSCNHCHDFEATYITYLRDNKPNIYSYYLADGSVASTTAYTETITAIGSYFGIERLNDNPFRYTPTVWIANKDGYYSISESDVSQQYLENAIKTRADFTNLYYFSSFSNFSGVDSANILTILYSQENDAESQFHNTFYSLAQSSSKDTYVLDYDTMSEAEQTLALSYFGLEEYALSFSINEETIKEEDALSYYGASSN